MIVVMHYQGIPLGVVNFVKDEVFYWASDRPAPLGMLVPLYQGQWDSPHEINGSLKRPLELMFEDVRQKEFPDVPSRIGSTMLCPYQHGWVCGPSGWSHLYEVRVTGKIFTTDMEGWTSAFNLAGNITYHPSFVTDLTKLAGPNPSLYRIIRSYWRGWILDEEDLETASLFGYPDLETLVDGEVIITRQIRP